MVSTIVITLLHLVSWVPTNAHACGFCDGDKAATVYSYKNLEWAKRSGNHYVVVEIIGLKSKTQVPNVISVLKSINGVFPKTITVSDFQKSASFVIEQNLSFEAVRQGFEETLGDMKLRLIAFH